MRRDTYTPFEILVFCLILLFITLCIQGCGSQDRVVVPSRPGQGPSPSVEVVDLGGYPKAAYDYLTEEWTEYPEVTKYFKGKECKAQAFFRALAYMESGYKLTTQYKEPKINGKYRTDPVTGYRLMSEGLFQMSYQDAKYWGCDFQYGADRYMRKENQDLKLLTIFRPEIQMDCALNLLNRMLKAEGHPFYNRSSTLANYWYPLKPRNTTKHQKFQRLYSENQKLFCR